MASSGIVLTNAVSFVLVESIEYDRTLTIRREPYGKVIDQTG